jgi:hypothetical protein
MHLFNNSLLIPLFMCPGKKSNRGSVGSNFDYQYSDILMQENLRIAANWIKLIALCLLLRTESIEKV